MKVKAISTLLTTISCDFKQCLRCIPSFACFVLLLNQQSNVILLFHANKAMQVSYYFKEFSSCYVICKLYYPNRKTWPRLPWIYIQYIYVVRGQVMPQGSAHWNSQLDFMLHLHRVLCLGNVIKQIIRHAMQGKQIKTKTEANQTKPSGGKQTWQMQQPPNQVQPPFFPLRHYSDSAYILLHGMHRSLWLH